MTKLDRGVLDEQLAYYRARAGEYDQWCAREGRYNRGEEHTRLWFGEIAVLEEALAKARPRGRCLELACGTGLWTRKLAPLCDHVAAVDASPEVIALNRARPETANVSYTEADLFAWEPEEGAYDFVFFSFWLSHVPEARFDAFWAMVARALAPGGTVFFIDNLHNPASTAVDHEKPATEGVVERKLNDGRRFRIVKLFHEPETLEQRLASLGWRAKAAASGEFFIYGEAAWLRA